MNILSIGNSFSCDAQRYLHRIAKADGVELNTFNLYIGGCPLAKHYRNMLSQQQEYVLEMNGNSTGFKVSLQEALLNRAWDVVTVQQASRNSVDYDSYQPYLDKLLEYVRMCVPKAKIIVHQTWAYAQESPRLAPVMGYSSYKQMLADLMSAYEKAAAAISADDMIPAGEVLDALLENGIENGAPTKYSGECPESEPEVAYLCNFIRFHENIQGILTLHTQGEEIFYQAGCVPSYKQERIAKELSALTGYRLSRTEGSACFGGLTDWCVQRLGLPSYTLECGKGENPLPLAQAFPIYTRLRNALFRFPLFF